MQRGACVDVLCVQLLRTDMHAQRPRAAHTQLHCCARHTVTAMRCLPATRPQVGFKRQLVKEVRAFVADAQAFRREWEANGPMVPGLEPMEAVDRLKKFQQMFEVRAAA